MKISKERLSEIIKEEFDKVVEKKKLITRLQEINSELGTINESGTIEEVEAGSPTKVRSHAWMEIFMAMLFMPSKKAVILSYR